MVIALTAAMVLKPMSESVASPAGDALEADAEFALEMLYASSPNAAEMGKDAKAILIFPKVVKIGFMFAGGFGEGVLIKDGKVGPSVTVMDVGRAKKITSTTINTVGSSRVDLQACKLEYSIVSPK